MKKQIEDLIEQIENSKYEDTGGFLKNNVAYIELKRLAQSESQLSNIQSFKSGISDMVESALKNNNRATLPTCEIKRNDGEKVNFEISVRILD